jgi:hypothetical protein
MVTSGTEAKEVPRVHGDVEFLDLFPTAASGGCGPKPRHVAKVVKPRRMNMAERELLKLQKRCSFDCYAQAYERIIDSISAVPLSWVLSRAGDCEMPEVGHLRQCFDESRYVGRCMEYRRVLLCQEIT